MSDAWRSYAELVLGLTEASRRRAEQVVRALLGRGEATTTQVSGYVEELIATGRANRDALVRLIRYEVERVLSTAGGAVGLATADDVAALTARVAQLEQRLAAQQPASPAMSTPAAGPPPAAKKVAKKTVAKKTTARKATVKKAPSGGTAGTEPGTGGTGGATR